MGLLGRLREVLWIVLGLPGERPEGPSKLLGDPRARFWRSRKGPEEDSECF